MISLNGLYTTLMEAIKILTTIEVYQNSQSNSKVVDAKWLFIKVIYYLFKTNDECILLLKKPTQTELAFQLGYSHYDCVGRVANDHIPHDINIQWKLDVLKYAFNSYGINSKKEILEVVIQAKYELWVRNNFKIIEDDKTI